MRVSSTLVAAPLLWLVQALSAAWPVPELAIPGVDPIVDARTVAVAESESLSVSLHPAAVGSPDGSGIPRTTVVLIPGPIGSAFSMRHITKALTARGVTSVVIDPLGMGTSSRPSEANYALSRQAQRVNAVLDTLGLARVLLVAQGTSATIALHMAADARERVTGVISIAGGGVDQQGTASVRLALTLAPLLDNAIGRSIARRRFMAGVKQQSFDASWCTPDVMHAYVEPFERDMRGGLRVLRAMHDAIETTPIAPRLREVSAPVLLLLGEKFSPNMPTADQVLALAHALPAFRVDTIAGAGTMVHEERPNAVVQAILEKLTSGR